MCKCKQTYARIKSKNMFIIITIISVDVADVYDDSNKDQNDDEEEEVVLVDGNKLI